MINAMVLAAGESKRMGKPKPLLRFGDTTFLEQIVSVLKASQMERTTVVLGAQAETIQETLDLSDAHVVVNEEYRKGQLSSVIAGLKDTPPGTEAILLCLADNPFITVDIVDQLVGTFRRTNAPIVVPTFNKRRGHPALFSSSVFKQIINAPPEEGARHVVYANEDKVVEVEMPENVILIGIDTPEDYRSHFGKDP